jgi:hypothetical protein
MSTKQTKEDASHRTARMAPAQPRRRGGGAPLIVTELFASSRALEYTAGAYTWR